jgi:hypothetical protein
MQQLPHITGLVSINADGIVLGPVTVLKNLQILGNLEALQSHCHFATSTNGWITKGLRTYFALVFAVQISDSPLTLPPEI